MYCIPERLNKERKTTIVTWLVSSVAKHSPLGFKNRMPVSGDPHAQVATTIHCKKRKEVTQRGETRNGRMIIFGAET